MITEGLLTVIFGIVSGFFSLLPDITWSVETSAFSYFMSILQITGYMFPWGTVVVIATLIFNLSIFRIVIAFIRAVWDLLPFA